jgi:hypothetical protein
LSLKTASQLGTGALPAELEKVARVKEVTFEESKSSWRWQPLWVVIDLRKFDDWAWRHTVNVD